MTMRTLVRGTAAAGLLALMVVGGACDSGSGATTDDDATADTAGESDATSTSDEGATTDTAATEDAAPVEDTTTVEDTDAAPDTSPADTGTQDTGAQDTAPQAMTCPEHLACATGACAQEAEADVATCLAGAEGTCGLASDSEDGEVTAAYALAECLAATPCPVDGTSKQWKCMAANCLTEDAACRVGTTSFGTGNCTDTRQCFAGCQPDIFGTPDYACLRGCAQVGTEQALETFLDLQYCLNEHCWDSADKVTCEQQAKGSFCQVEESNCSGDLG